MPRFIGILLFVAWVNLGYANFCFRDGMQVVRPGDATYDEARKSRNLRFNYRPIAIAYPREQGEVVQAVQMGVENNWKIVARSGGHSYTATSIGGRDNSFIIDLSCLNQIEVNTDTNVAIIGAGNRLGRVAAHMINENRATAHGTCPSVGIGGHIAYGGFGFTSRMWGLATDNVISMDVVLANGSMVHTSQDVNRDLFWAMRGAGGSFAIATRFEVQLHEMPGRVTYFEFRWTLNAESALAAIVAFQNFAQTNIPSTLGIKLDFRKPPRRGHLLCSLRGGWYGPEGGFADVVSPFLSVMPDAMERDVSTGSYRDSVAFFARDWFYPGDPGEPSNFYAKSLMTPENAPLSLLAMKTFIDTLVIEGHNHPSVAWLAQFELIGGHNSAINRIPIHRTSYVHRKSLFLIQVDVSATIVAGQFPEAGFDFANGLMRSITENMPPAWAYGAFLNFIDDKLENWQELYYKDHYAALLGLKARFDPQSRFGGYRTAIEQPIQEQAEQVSFETLEGQMAMLLGKIYKYTHRSNY